MEIEISDKLMAVKFSANVMPKFIEKKIGDDKLILWGENNNYPAFLLDLYRNHPEHGAIIKAKSKYIAGKGLKAKAGASVMDQARGNAFLQSANRYENWDSVFEKTVNSLEVFNGFAWQIIWDVFGRKCEVFCVQLSKLRRSSDGTKVYYCDRWVDDNGNVLTKSSLERYGYQEFPAFDPMVRKGTQIYYYTAPAQYHEEYNIYPRPEYEQILLALDTDVAVSVFQNALVCNGMSAQGMLSLFNGEPNDAEKKKYKQMLDRKVTGPKNAGQFFLNFVDKGPDAKGAEWTTFQVSDMDKQFEQICKNNQQKIISGHQIPNKSLVGISVEGALSDRTAIIESFEQLYNTYVEPRQKMLLREVEMIADLLGLNVCFEVQRLAPIGIDYLDPNITKYMTTDEVRDKMGLPPLPEGKTVSASSEMDAPAEVKAQVNENLKKLSGREWQNIKRLQREVTNGKCDRNTAAMILKNGYALTDDDIAVLLPINGQFKAFAKFELDHVVGLFESRAEFMGARDLKNYVLDFLKGNPEMLPERMARLLDVESDFILETIKLLEKEGLIERSAGKLTPTDKGIDRNTPNVVTEIETVYKYVTREDVPRAEQTRPFCARLLKLSREGKVWTREAIDNITNEIGEDAWSYRGGWYTNPDTGETSTHCRHIWKAITRAKRG